MDAEKTTTQSETWDRLFPYQKEGVEQLVRILTSEDGHRGALLADPIGAGKSCQTVMTFKRLGCRRVLIVCPKSLKLNWAREVERWSDGQYGTVVLKNSQDEVPLRSDDGRPMVVIVNYHLTCREPMRDALQEEPWDFVAFDEAHAALRSPTANVSRVCAVLLWRNARYRLPITGTPVPNGRASEAYILFSRLAPDLFGDWAGYRDRYCIAVASPWGVKYPRSKNLEELGSLARQRFMVRRRPEDVLAQLPGLVRQTIPLEIPRLKVEEAQEGEEGQAAVDIAAVLRMLEAGGMPLTSDPISTARRKLGILKVEPALEFLLELLEEVDSCVVFAHHREVFYGLKEGLEREEVPVVCISGLTPAGERQEAVDAFQEGRARVFLGSLTAASTGITLTRSSTAVFVESSWVPSDNTQAEGRVFRVSQKEICRAIYLVVPDSLDEHVQRSVVRKQRNIEKVMAA